MGEARASAVQTESGGKEMLRLVSKSLQWQAARSGWGSVAVAATAAPTATTVATMTSSSPLPLAYNGSQPGSCTEFVRRASQIKRRFRGKGQYAYAREEAQRFLDAEVPKTKLHDWIDEGTNAVALSQILRFFEVQPEASLLSLLLGKLIKLAEGSAVDAGTRLEAALALVATRPDENYERAIHTISEVMQQVYATQSSNGTGEHFSPRQRWVIYGKCSKLLQRCGKHAPPSLTEQIAQSIVAHLQTVSPQDLPNEQSELIRIYAWLVRAERPEMNQVLYLLVEHSGEFKSFDFATLLNSCGRHHQIMPLPVELVQRLARTGLCYSTNSSGREAASVLGTVAKILSTLEVGRNDVGVRDISKLQDHFNALLEEYQPRVLRFLSPADVIHWDAAEDICAIVFAYELGGRMRYHRMFTAFGQYVETSVQCFEPPQLALATGILRRAGLLTPELASRLSERIEVVLGELRLAELSHICATYAVLPPPRPSWWMEARVVAMRLFNPNASGAVRINLALAFPDQPDLLATVDYSLITTRQLVDLLPITIGSPQWEEPVLGALCLRLRTPSERFSPDDLRLLLQCGREVVGKAAQEYLRNAMAQPEWSTDILYCLPLVWDAAQAESMKSFYAAKALAAAQAASVSPEQFVSLVELLTSLFGDNDAGIHAFVRNGGEDLLQAQDVSIQAVLRYLATVRRFPTMVPTPQWLHLFLEKKGMYLKRLKPELLEDLLISLRSIYEDVARTPELQSLLSTIVEQPYSTLAGATEQTARITVLLVYLQKGISLPLLHSQQPTVMTVLQKEATYSDEVRKALAVMPIEKPATGEERRGRFVLKHLDRHRRSGEDELLADVELNSRGAPPSLDLNTTDPFDMPAPQRSSGSGDEGNGNTSSLTTPPVSEPPPVSPVPPMVASSSLTSASAPASDAPPTTSATTTAPAEGTTPVEPESAPRAPSNVSEEKRLSYYAKFFSSSVGQLFTGRHGVEDSASLTTAPVGDEVNGGTAAKEIIAQTPVPLPSTSSVSLSPDVPLSSNTPSLESVEQLRPRRTKLARSATASSFASTSQPPIQPLPSSPLQHPGSPLSMQTPVPPPQQQPHQPSVTTPLTQPLTPGLLSSGAGFTANWSAAGGAPSGPGASWIYPPARSTAPQGSSAFSSLFGAPNTFSQQSPPPAPTPVQSTPLPTAALSSSPASAAARTRPQSGGGNNVFFDPTRGAKSAAPGPNDVTAPRGRVMISKKSFVPRIAGPRAPLTSVEGVHSPPPPPPPVAENLHQMYATATTGGGAPQRRATGLHSLDSTSNATAVPHVAGGSTDAFMQRAGVARISGYDVVSDAAANTSAAAMMTSSAAVERQPVAWQETAKYVARVTRHPRTKAKTKVQTSLSAWLSTPSATFESAAGATSAEEAADDAQKKGRGVRGQRAKKVGGKAAAAASDREKNTRETERAPVKRGGGRDAGNHHHNGSSGATTSGKASKAPQGKRKAEKTATVSVKKTPAKGGKGRPTSAASVIMRGKAATGGAAPKKVAAAIKRVTPVVVKPAKKAVKAVAKKVAAVKKNAKGKKK